MSYTVYILQREFNGRYYIGSTADLVRRLERHNEGRSEYTKRGIPWKVVHTEQYDTRAEAVRREKQIKGRKSRAYIDGLIRTSR